MAARKRIRRRLGTLLIPALGSRLMTWLHRTCRWTFVGREPLTEIIGAGQAFVCPTWHFNLVSVLYHFRGVPSVVMVSRSSDGEMIARMVARWNYVTVRGSRHKGGMDAAKDMIRLVRSGLAAGIVADGSQGPARKAQKGAVFVARASGAAVVPAIVVARRKITLPTWDRMQIPLPFTRMVMYFGEPFKVPHETDGAGLEVYRAKVEQVLNELCRKAENHAW